MSSVAPWFAYKRQAVSDLYHYYRLLANWRDAWRGANPSAPSPGFFSGMAWY